MQKGTQQKNIADQKQNQWKIKIFTAKKTINLY